MPSIGRSPSIVHTLARSEHLPRRRVFGLLMLASLLVGCARVPASTAASEESTNATPTTAVSSTLAPTTTTVAPTTVAPTTVAPTTVAPTTHAPTTTATPPLREITTDAPLRGWVGGDSLPAYIVTALSGGSADRSLLDLRWDPRISSSIVRPSFVDWHHELSILLGSDDAPEAIVFMIGGNDNQPMTSADGVRLPTLSPEWQLEYRRRVAALMDLTALEGTRMLWIGLPPPKDGIRLELNPAINTIIAEESANRPWVSCLDIDPLFRDAEGNYADRLAGPDGGDPIRVRPSDGVHITYGASTWIADLVWQWMTDTWPMVGDG